MANIILGTSADDNLIGTAGADDFHLRSGGTDTVQGLQGNDVFRFGATFTAADSIDGGADIDHLVLNGDYSGPNALILAPASMVNVEYLNLVKGFDYSVTTDDANVAAGEVLHVKAKSLGAANHVVFDGSAETDGRFVFEGGAGDDIATLSANSDRIYLTLGGDDTVSAGDGSDLIVLGAALTASDHIDGGADVDTLSLNGDYSGANTITLQATTLVNVEYITVSGGHSYGITSNDATVALGDLLVVDGSFLGAGDSLKFDGSAETNGSFVLIDGLGNDVLKGGAKADLLSFDGGGTDTGFGGAGADFFDACGHFDSTDRFDGGGGYDIIELTAADTASGNYTGADALVLTAAMLGHFEEMDLDPGGSYDITTVDATVAAGKTFTVDGSFLDVGDALKFDGSAENDGAFQLFDGLGNDILIGGAGADFLGFDGGGTDTGSGGDGDDFLDACGHFDSTDQFDGGSGYDIVELTAADTASGNYTGADALVLTAAMLSHFEEMDLDPGGSYDITTVDATVDAGTTFTIDGSLLGAGEDLTVDGSAETDGLFSLSGGAGDDVLTGGAGDDTFHLGSGNDTVRGGGGGDLIEASTGAGDSATFVYFAVSESTSTGFDTIAVLNFDTDVFEIAGAATLPSGVDAEVVGGTLTSGNFDADLATAIGAGQLAANHVVLFAPDTGTFTGSTFLVVDANGSTGYQASADLVFDVTGFTGTLDASDFT